MATCKESAYWALAHRKATIYGTECFYARGDVLDVLEQLPAEFFGHELLDCNPDSNSELEQFSKTWGLLFHPLRFLDVKIDDLTLFPEAAFSFRFAIDSTDAIARKVAQEGGEFAFSGIVSLEESRLALRFLQSMAKAAFACIGSNQTAWEFDIAGCINPLARPQRLFGIYREDYTAPRNSNNGCFQYLPIECQKVEFTLANAVANQIIETHWDNSTEWKRCPWCGHYFKKRRVFSDRVTKTDRQQSNSKYCSEKCSQRIKDYRRDKRGAPDWWTPEQAEAEKSRGKRKK